MCGVRKSTSLMSSSLHKNAVSNIEQVLEATPHKAAAIRPPTTHHENHKKFYQRDMLDTAR